MSITVQDVLKLPSMRGAKVIGGKKGLTKIVSSISVLEYAQINAVQTELFNNIEFVGNELAITGFLNNPDDVELQCANIRRMVAVGEVGLILFYVGVVMKKVDPKLIQLADSLNFALICMPEGQINQRYSEVICEVMDLIYRDQMDSTSLVIDLLERAGSLPAHQRTVDSLLRMLADRLRASVVLMDSFRRVLNEAAWPRAIDPRIKRELSAAAFPEPATWKRHERLNMQIFRDTIQTRDRRGMDLLIFREGDALDVVTTRQAVEAVQLAVTIWSGNHDGIAIGELVRAILQDEPLKMRRLADIFHVDIASINSMWLLCGAEARDRTQLAELTELIQQDTRAYSAAAFADIYNDVLVLFMVGPASLRDVRALTDAILQELHARDIRATLTRCHALNTTTRVREAFLSHQAGLNPAREIFPGRQVFTLEQIVFAQRCHALLEQGEQAVTEALRCLDNLRSAGEGAGLLKTLECFLLDAGMSVKLTAESMFLHNNTIKYRLQRISDLLGFVPGDFPESIPLLTACALRRLLRRN